MNTTEKFFRKNATIMNLSGDFVHLIQLTPALFRSKEPESILDHLSSIFPNEISVFFFVHIGN